jgi:hypothetical protein
MGICPCRWATVYPYRLAVVLALGYERADDVGLPALVEQAAHAPEHLVAPVERQHPRHDRRAPRRHLVEHGDVEVAVDRERERARDRRRRHVQDVR